METDQQQGSRRIFEALSRLYEQRQRDAFNEMSPPPIEDEYEDDFNEYIPEIAKNEPFVSKKERRTPEKRAPYTYAKPRPLTRESFDRFDTSSDYEGSVRSNTPEEIRGFFDVYHPKENPNQKKAWAGGGTYMGSIHDTVNDFAKGKTKEIDPITQHPSNQFFPPDKEKVVNCQGDACFYNDIMHKRKTLPKIAKGASMDSAFGVDKELDSNRMIWSEHEDPIQRKEDFISQYHNLWKNKMINPLDKLIYLNRLNKESSVAEKPMNEETMRGLYKFGSGGHIASVSPQGYLRSHWNHPQNKISIEDLMEHSSNNKVNNTLPDALYFLNRRNM